MITSARDPKYTADGKIDLIVTVGGVEFPFTAADDDVEAHGRELFARAASGEFGDVEAYVETVTAVIVPVVVTPRQAKLALLSAGLLDAVEGAIEAITDPATKRVAQIEWEYAQEVRRDWPLLNAVAGGMGMADAQIDDLFTLAATL